MIFSCDTSAADPDHECSRMKHELFSIFLFATTCTVVVADVVSPVSAELSRSLLGIVIYLKGFLRYNNATNLKMNDKDEK